MFRKKTYQTIRVRFRKWNRKGYALFASLHKIVSIGKVGLSISDKSLKKSKTGVLKAIFDTALLQLNDVGEEPDTQQNNLTLVAIQIASGSDSSSSTNATKLFILTQSGYISVFQKHNRFLF